MLELLTVIAIISIVSVLAVPAFSSLVQSSSLSKSAELIAGQLSLARQFALSRNAMVEVRLYQFEDPEMPGEGTANPGSGKYRAIQLFQIPRSAPPLALGKMQRLPGSVLIDSGSELSSIVAQGQPYPSSPALATGASLNVPIPQVGLKYNAVSFRFLPDGSVDLSPSTARWFLTLHNASAGDGLQTPPPNFCTLQINVANGHIQSFRP